MSSSEDLLENKDNSSEVLIAEATAAIAYFSMFFPDNIRDGAMISSSKIFTEPDMRVEFLALKERKDTYANEIIESLARTMLKTKDSDTENCNLIHIFELLYSIDSIEQRGRLISTLKVILDCIKKKSPNTPLCKWIRNSYSIYCEAASLNGCRINFKSGNYYGSYVSEDSFFKPSEDEDAPDFPPEGGEVLYINQRIPFDWSKKSYKNQAEKVTYLESIYNKLAKDNELFWFPNGKKEWIKDPESGKYYPKECSSNNFINMFEGVFDNPEEHRPKRVELNGSVKRLSKFIDAMEFRHGTRQAAQNALRELIVFKGGGKIGKTSLQKNKRQ